MDTPSRHGLVSALLGARTAVLADLDRSPGAPERLLVRSDVSGTMQLFEYTAAGLTPLTDLPEPVRSAHYVPGSRMAVLEVDSGGNERVQLLRLDLDAVLSTGEPLRAPEDLEPLAADPRFGHHYAGISRDGRQLAYVSDRDGGVDFDLWTCELAGGEHTLVWRSGGWAQSGSGFSPDGRWVSVLVPGGRALDDDLWLIDVRSGAATAPLAHPGQAALVGAPAWTGVDRFLVSHNIDRDVRGLATVELKPAGELEITQVTGSGERFDADVLVSRDGSTAIVVENANGASLMRPLELDGKLHAEDVPGALGPVIATSEEGVTAGILSADGTRFYYTLSAPRVPGDVFVHNLESGGTRRLTESPAELPAAQLVTPELTTVTSFDGTEVPLYVYRPLAPSPANERPPAVVFVHGGPESQAVRGFNPIIQALVAVGYGVVVPNVRGSTGYGKRYAALDDTTRRLDSVRDLAAVHGGLPAIGLDPARAALWGGSYGGYMVLAGLAFQPELWAAGVDIVGISNLVSFLENTSPYRRAHRELEYGSLEHDRAFLAEASPLTHVEAMRAPLFVIHGRNDPRVPVSEAEQLIASLETRGVRCELRIYEDEGHGLARLANRLDAFPRAITFLDEALGRGARGTL